MALGQGACGGHPPDEYSCICIGDDTAPDALVVCDPVTQTGCDADEKCTWIIAAADPEVLGYIGCAPAGPGAIDEACTVGPPGVTTGFDDCDAGLYCHDDRCTSLCSLDVEDGSCGEGLACVQHARTLHNDGQPPAAGLCEARCDPFTQRLPADPVDTFCGGALDADGQQTAMCAGVLQASDTTTHFLCTDVRNPGFTHGTVLDLDGGFPGWDRCAPRTLTTPVLTFAGELEWRCLALCEPGDAWNGSVDNLHRLVGSPYALPALGITSPTEECRYLRWFEDPTQPPSDYAYSVGVAFDVARFTAWDGDPMSCADVADADLDGDRVNDAVAAGCKRPPDAARRLLRSAP